MNSSRFWLVTGIPRSGTTLLGKLLSNLDNFHCLSEPSAVGLAAQQAESALSYSAWLEQHLRDRHQALMETRQVETLLGADGQPVSNYFERLKDGRIVNTFQVGVMPLQIHPDRPYTLAVKHNAPFLAALPTLIQNPAWQIMAIVRHPVATLLSWRSLNLPVSQGQLPAAEHLWPELKIITATEDELWVRLARLYETLLQRIFENKNSIKIIGYENLIQVPEILTQITGHAYLEKQNLNHQDRQDIYQWQEKERIIEALQKHAPWTCKVYPNLQDHTCEPRQL